MLIAAFAAAAFAAAVFAFVFAVFAFEPAAVKEEEKDARGLDVSVVDTVEEDCAWLVWLVNSERAGAAEDAKRTSLWSKSHSTSADAVLSPTPHVRR